MPDSAPSVRRSVAAAVPLLLAAAALAAAAPGTARAAAVPGEATGPTGQKLTVSETKNINPAGLKVTVTGTGYDVTKGIYLAVCRVPAAPGEQPSPCLGGSDFTGGSGSTHWISNNPPAYGQGLVKKFTVGADGKGSFTLELTVKAKDSGADCTQVRCAVVTRADHTHISDRDQDVIVPVSFSSGNGGEPTPEVPAGTVRHQAVRTLTPAVGAAQHIAADPAAGRLYVASDDGSRRQLTTYNTGTGRITGTPVELPAPVSALALDAPARSLHLALGDRIATYDTRTGTLADNKAKLSGHVHLLAAHPAGGTVYAAVQPARSVTVFATGRSPSTVWRQIGKPAVHPFPVAGLAVDTAARRAYTTYVGPNTSTTPMSFHNVLTAIDGRTGRTVGTPLSLGTTALGSMGVTVDPVSRTGYVANLAAGTVFAVDLRASRVTGTLQAGSNPKALAYDGGSGTLYAASTTAPVVTAVDPAGRREKEELTAGDRPSGLALDPGTQSVFVVAEGKVTQLQRRVSPAQAAAPKAVTAVAGKQAVFTASATGTPAPTTGWEVSSDGSTWLPVAGASGPRLAFTAAKAHHGNRYRAVFSNSVGSLRSAPAVLKVTDPPKPPPGGPAPQSVGGTGTSGTSGTGGSSTGGTSTGGTGGTTTGGTVGGSSYGAEGSTGSGSSGGGGGSLASTGTSALGLTAIAAALAATGTVTTLYALRRRRTP
ncbi:YncE family protein [Streptomyces tsukubensis]|uniref:YncE family protein n=1 Tax=Streptomyces tsukubensis TaxID=83656 RepID=UPI003450FB31